ncbi:hypothetical protein GGS21DRAFT_95898 [Xylaria nigripes]|nr:hypothetical protein GGS21DRAFT_95898 [Xylaria nigripes]
MGCTTCRNYGLICVVEDGIALPPRPEVAVLSRTAFSMCDPCRANKTRCDRQRACNACITRNTPNECVGGTGRGTFTRGAGHGTELYTYVSIMGGGLNGLQDPVKFNAVYDQPADIHLQYIQWLEGGPLPVPPGYAQPYETPPRPDIRLRALPFPLPVMSAQSPGQARTPAQAHTPAGPAQQPVEQPVEQLMQQPIVPQPIVPQPFQPATPIDILDAGEELADPGITSNMQDYENAWSTAKINASNGQVIDLAKLRVSLREALFSGIPAKQSIAAQPYLNLNEKLPEARPVVIPHGVDENEVALLGLGARTIFNLGQDLQFPPSPAPTGRIFDIVGVNDIIGDVTLAPYDPEYTDLRLISAEQPNHPNPSSIPALQTISSLSLFNTVADDDIFCSEIKLDGDFCLDMTRRQCEDLSHDAARPLAVCDECNDMSRARFEKHLASISIMMRAYACFTCAMAEITNPHNYNGRRFNVWGLPPNVFRDNEEFSSRNRGPPLPLTGCHCASKLLDRRLCTPHRLEHYLAIRSKAQDMRDFVLATLGRMTRTASSSRDTRMFAWRVAALSLSTLLRMLRASRSLLGL